MIIFLKSSLVLLDLKSLGAQNMTFSLLNKKKQKTYPPKCAYSLLATVSVFEFGLYLVWFLPFLFYILLFVSL